MRQYIGARYVPKFFDDGNGSTEWIPGVAYEPLTIVTHLGNSYTSKKPVPVGIDILNTDYWASTGLWNAQVDQIRDDLTDTQNEVANILNSHYIVIGDSYTNYASPHNVPENIRTALNIPAANWHVSNIGGAGFIGAFNGKNFKDLLDDLATEMTDLEDYVTNIIVIGGANDGNQTTADMVTAINTFEASAHSTYKNAKITYYWVGLKSDLMMKQARRFKDLTGSGAKIGVVCMSDLIFTTSYDYSTDGIHPTNSVLDKIARYIANHISDGTMNIRERYNIKDGIDNFTTKNGNITYGSIGSDLMLNSTYFTASGSARTIAYDAGLGGYPLIRFGKSSVIDPNVINGILASMSGIGMISVNNGSPEPMMLYTEKDTDDYQYICSTTAPSVVNNVTSINAVFTMTANI